jgi:hypothetical protein
MFSRHKKIKKFFLKITEDLILYGSLGWLRIQTTRGLRVRFSNTRRDPRQLFLEHIMSTVTAVIPVVITNLAGDYIETITAPTNLYGNEMGSHTWLDEVQDDIRGNLSNPEEWNAYCGGSWVSSSEL